MKVIVIRTTVTAAKEEPAVSILLETAKVLKDSLFKTP
jgi:hypothetical protein